MRLFWLDEAEPEYTVYDFDNYRYSLGSNLQVGNLYPVMYAKAFFDGMRAEGQERIVNLLRCAWAGSQRYGALVWSGDIASSFQSFRNQLAAGLNMGMAGIPGGLRTLAASMAAIPMIPHSGNCLPDGLPGVVFAPSCVCMETANHMTSPP